MKSIETIFQRDDQNQPVDLDLIKPPFLAFVKNEKLLNIVEGEVIGSLRILKAKKKRASWLLKDSKKDLLTK